MGSMPSVKPRRIFHELSVPGTVLCVVSSRSQGVSADDVQKEARNRTCEATSDSGRDITVCDSTTYQAVPPGIFEPVTFVDMDRFLRACPRPTKVHPFVHLEPLGVNQVSLSLVLCKGGTEPIVTGAVLPSTTWEKEARSSLIYQMPPVFK